jgi:hypothetical protein
MTTGLTYTGGGRHGNVFTSYFGATTDLTRSRQKGIVHWPGSRSETARNPLRIQNEST